MEKRRFRFLKKLSEGTFGKVYLAEMITENKFSKVVAIKVLHAKWVDHDEIVRRSRDEARVLGRLQHRNIINVIDLISIGGKCSVIMEYLDGVDLKSLINFCAKNNMTIPRRVVFEIISSVASALDAAYNRPPLQGGKPLRLIHRDIKPSNIMLTTEADVKVLDFGTAQAKFEDREAETQALAFGSAAYMSPERFLGDDDRISGDVYALGVTLYELLFQGRYGKANVRQEIFYSEQERRLSKLNFSTFEPDIGERIHRLLKGMLAWEEKERPELSDILVEAEHLAQLINDGSLKRFSREIVQKCKEELQPDAGSDTLEGEVLVEDGTQSSSDFNDIIQNTSTASSQPKLNITTPEEDLQRFDTGLGGTPSVYNLNHLSSLPTAEIPKNEIENTEDTQDNEAEEVTVVATPETIRPPKKSGGLKIGLVLGAVVVLGLVGIGTFWVVNADKTTEKENEPTNDISIDKGEPGIIDDLGASEDSSQAILEVRPAGRATVLIRGKGGIKYQYKWNGEGKMILKNAPAGTYQTRFENSEKILPSSLIDLKAGENCSFILDIASGAEQWRKEC